MYWKKKLKKNICSIEQLKKYIDIDEKEKKILKKIVDIHPMSVTSYYLSLINKKDKNDPIRKLIIPSEYEMDVNGFYDSSVEKENTKKPGLQHKYGPTALILSTSECASYCRFCFRKRLVGLSNKEILRRFGDAINYIKSHKEINNVLVSGGDSLMLDTDIIDRILKEFSKIDHLDFIRFGTRIPVVFPDRILDDKKLLEVLKKHSKKNRRIYVVTHFNHPREITEKSVNAIDKLINSNVIVNNQTVLLKGVNDNSKTLTRLLNRLVSIGVNPYYIFQCRPVKRVMSNFQIPFHKGYKIIEEAKKKINGHSKRFRYIMSNRTGKIEIVAIDNKYMYFKYLHARDRWNDGKFFKTKLDKKATWLYNLR